MAAIASQLRCCPTCGSDDRDRVGTDIVPGGTDWRYFECASCGYEWRE